MLIHNLKNLKHLLLKLSQKYNLSNFIKINIVKVYKIKYTIVKRTFKNDKSPVFKSKNSVTEKFWNYFFFDFDIDSPYMLITSNIKNNQRLGETELKNFEGFDKLKIQKSSIPAVTHVDYSARIHSIDEKRNPKFYNLIKHFKKKTDCPAIINTSFNIRGGPIVCTPEDAYRCFMNTEMDILVIENYVLEKKNQKQENIFKSNYFDKYLND